MVGALSAVYDSLSAATASFINPNIAGGPGLNVETYNGLAINAVGNVTIHCALSADSIEFTGIAVNQTFDTPVTATGNFLKLSVNGQPWAIRLWNYQ